MKNLNSYGLIPAEVLDQSYNYTDGRVLMVAHRFDRETKSDQTQGICVRTMNDKFEPTSCFGATMYKDEYDELETKEFYGMDTKWEDGKYLKDYDEIRAWDGEFEFDWEDDAYTVVAGRALTARDSKDTSSFFVGNGDSIEIAAFDTAQNAYVKEWNKV